MKLVDTIDNGGSAFRVETTLNTTDGNAAIRIKIVLEVGGQDMFYRTDDITGNLRDTSTPESLQDSVREAHNFIVGEIRDNPLIQIAMLANALGALRVGA